jgi:hypothetical protein
VPGTDLVLKVRTVLESRTRGPCARGDQPGAPHDSSSASAALYRLRAGVWWCAQVVCMARELEAFSTPRAATLVFAMIFCRRDRFRTYDPYRVKVTMGVS